MRNSINILAVNTKLLLPLIFLTVVTTVLAQLGPCDQTPLDARVKQPSENNGIYKLTLQTKKDDKMSNLFLPDQTYILKLEETTETRPFRAFMITAEDPDLESRSEMDRQEVDVGTLKTLDTDPGSRYSERCYNSVENTDFSNKYKVEIHWVSPKHPSDKQKVQFRAMVEENEEAWYTGENLTIVLVRDDSKAIDSPPYDPVEECNLCSEARYEVIFKGQWSRGLHPRHYPSKPDDNGYSHMVGASHSYNYDVWKQGKKASMGLMHLAEFGDITMLERDILSNVSEYGGTRTLIRGKKHFHPYMAAPSHSLFRVDRIHHMFSIAVAMRPSPDWFLGTSRFELCSENGWLEHSEIPLYPWDAGIMDGISYESLKAETKPPDNVDRVAVGSFNPASPFYQLNLNSLPPFAWLEVRRLDVYELEDADCDNAKSEPSEEPTVASPDGGEEEEEDMEEESKVAESRQKIINYEEENCRHSEWGPWSECTPNFGSCGVGTQTRRRLREENGMYYETYKASKDDSQVTPMKISCQDDIETGTTQNGDCYIEC